MPACDECFAEPDVYCPHCKAMLCRDHGQPERPHECGGTLERLP